MFQQLILITYILQSRLIYNNAINLQNNYKLKLKK